MHLLLLGCTGFIGKELVPKLLGHGHKLTLVGRTPFGDLSNEIKSHDLNYLQLDPSKEDTWLDPELIKSLEECDVVLNLAGEPIAEKRWSTSHCNVLIASRVETTRLLVQAMGCIKRPPKTLINASAIGFYGTSLDVKFKESSQEGRDFLAKLCKDWESEAQSKPRTTRLVIFRFGIVLAPDGGALGKMLPLFRAGLGGPLGNGMQWMSWIHRTDLCELIYAAIINKSWKGVVNAVAPKPVSMAFFSSTLGKVIGRPTILPVPGPLLRMMLGDGAKVVLEGQYVESERLEKFGFKFQFSSLNEAFKNLIK